MSSWWLFGAVPVVHQHCGQFVFGQKFGLMVNGDEMCLRLGESVGRLNLNTVSAG